MERSFRSVLLPYEWWLYPKGTVPASSPRPPTSRALTAAQQERYEERAAIMEFDGGLTRAEAEKKAGEAVWGPENMSRIGGTKVTPSEGAQRSMSLSKDALVKATRGELEPQPSVRELANTYRRAFGDGFREAFKQITGCDHFEQTPEWIQLYLFREWLLDAVSKKGQGMGAHAGAALGSERQEVKAT